MGGDLDYLGGLGGIKSLKEGFRRVEERDV